MTKEEKIKLFQEAETTDCGDCTECIFRGDTSKCVSYSAMNFVYEKASQEVAKAIFEELDTFIVTKVIDHGTINYDIGDRYVALKKKYLGENINFHIEEKIGILQKICKW